MPSFFQSFTNHRPDYQAEIASARADEAAEHTHAGALQKTIDILMGAHTVIEFDTGGAITSANDNFLSTFGYTLDELRGHDRAILLAPSARDGADDRRFWEQLSHGQPVSGEFRRVSRDGTPVWLLGVYTPVPNADGSGTHIAGFGHVITADKERAADHEGQLAAINKSQAVITFSLDGRIIEANENFCAALGYSREELVGQPHSMLVDAEYRKSADYRRFWEKLGRGEYQARQFKRIGKGGREVWIQASYNPILDAEGKPCKVVKFATDITAEKQRNADYEGQLAAINKSQAVITFGLDGVIQEANPNFCEALGYTREELVGKHHSMLVEPGYRDSAEYREFWQKLGRGEYQAGQFKRIGKGGREVWIQASYNPILDADGKPFKVVKFATDITTQVRAAHALEHAVGQTQDVVKAAQDGDLTQRIELDGKAGSIRDLCAGVNDLVENMAGVVGRIKTAASAIDTAAREIAAGNTDLSSRTEEQAASLEETASSMEELTSTVKQNAENAKQANQLAIGASDVASRGGQVVSEVVTTMSSISAASKKIAEIISVIDGIAFQTNILALNAAVEAARAGEQGRGFAVVASEVRSLAQRSAGAAKEIKSLINDSVERVGTGSKLVEQAGSTMNEIVTSVKRVTDIMAEISAASSEQSQGIEQVNTTITQMDEVTQQNAALVEEASASAKSLEEQADGLTTSVSRFRIGDNDVPAPAVAAPVPRPATRKPTPALHSVSRPAHKPAPRPAARAPLPPTGTDDQWTEF